ncbi:MULTISPECIES: MetQ/NlpA family ABC transporter substrate-binding protein [Vibrio]|uniref:Lipoprotein n=2 Tax=Vibrio TaxID=662 RepID=A0A7X4LQC7_9VIBR|nr:MULTISPECIES: MetQ/NlpA family ABC transporter substrate-binding protein [Vibrio]MBF9003519.1 MetQ/NlpA family ABC transporter substrate-binding protein [Vibrio nitrifigilis]MZI96086.1 methionine ABC transporter substrate-binding protein [Vibrio eleionomae]
MKGFKTVGHICLTLILTAGLSACGDKESKEIKVGATVGPHAQVVEAVAKEAAKQGLKVTVVKFNDYVTPDAALADGSIDLNSYQHLPFLQNYNANHDSNLVSIGQSILMRMGIYSRKVSSLSELPDNARIAIPNDPTNEGRGLLLLQSAKLIRLKTGVGYNATINDVIDNPKHIEFIEIDAAQLPRTLDDVDAAAITMNYVMSSGLDPKKVGIYLEPKDAPLAVMVVAARAKDKDNADYKKFMKIFQSEETKAFLDKTFKGTIEPAF